MLKNNNGITLVALTITIILLLILASITTYSGVHTIRSARFYNATAQMKLVNSKVSELYDEWKNGNTGVLDYGVIADSTCDNAFLAANIQEDEKQNYRIYTKAFIEENLDMQGIDYDFLVNVQKRDVILKDGITYGGDECFTLEDFGIYNVAYVDQGTTNRAEIHVGDYINYTPDTANAYTTDKLAESITGSTSNTTDIAQDTLTWQVLRIYEDGSMDLIGSPTSQSVYFGGALGYNNGVYLMHDICESLYSKPSKGITARSVNLEDFDYWLTYAGKTERDSDTYDGFKYGDAKTFIEDNSYYPILYSRENNSGVDLDITGLTEEEIKNAIKNDGITDSDKYYTSPTTETYKQSDTKKLTVTTTNYNITINSTNYGEGYKVLSSSSWYLLASRCADLDSNNSSALFGLRIASSSIRSLLHVRFVCVCATDKWCGDASCSNFRG